VPESGQALHNGLEKHFDFYNFKRKHQASTTQCQANFFSIIPKIVQLIKGLYICVRINPTHYIVPTRKHNWLNRNAEQYRDKKSDTSRDAHASGHTHPNKTGVTSLGEQVRYPGEYLKTNDLLFIIQFRGTTSECLKEEKRKLFKYPLLPENIARPDSLRLILPPGNSKIQ
jgi:hypothetical protein